MENKNTKLDTESLRNAISALKDSIDVFREYGEKSAVLFLSLRSGVIQNFEVSYELCWKFMQKWLEMNISDDIVKGVCRKEFYRICEQYDLIENAEIWWKFHAARNSTSHSYSSSVASSVCDTAIEFLQSAQDFAKNFEKKL
ncbi:MAG: nucleotidyltransferase substrate binding protein [Chitinivibrionia bacterium]|nr:nucleotidyltransferase substrate binding protein [Chitinivibrionia bacterium]